ncbi:hypothetical protein LTS08_004770 [Lithohypha guttulata]|nr:hypothetical protein LTS08_004770 [Lithohypha guttulata]
MQYAGDIKYNYLGIATLARNNTYDFTARSFALHTRYTPISRACGLNTNVTTNFNCNNGAFSIGDGLSLDQASLTYYPFRQFDMTKLDPKYGVDNPFYYAAATLKFASSGSPILNDLDVVSVGNMIAAVFFCKVIAFDIEYDSPQGQVRQLRSTVGSTSIANVLSSALTFGWGQSKMKADMDVAAILVSTAQEYADVFAETLSHTLLSSAAGSVRHIPATTVQVGKTLLVTILPRIPLYSLLSLNFAVILTGIVLTLLAACTTAQARKEQRYLTVDGVIDLLEMGDNMIAGNNQVDGTSDENLELTHIEQHAKQDQVQDNYGDDYYFETERSRRNRSMMPVGQVVNGRWVEAGFRLDID